MLTVDEKIAKRLRQDVISGRLPLGARLPDRLALAQRYGAGLATVQVAVARLVTEGFLHVGARRQGTFVAQRPPHLYHYKVVFPFGPQMRPGFWQVLHDEVQRVAAAGTVDISCWFGLGGHGQQAEYAALVQAVVQQRLAGLIFASSAYELRGTPVLDQPGLPRAMVAVADEHPGIPKIAVDHADFFRRAAAYLRAQGCRRLALLCASEGPLGGAGLAALGQRELAAAGFSVRPEWVQFVNPAMPLAANHCTQLLLRAAPPHRPDGLLVADDTLVAAATAGLAALDRRTPLPVVAMANFPAVPVSAVPVVHLGFDVPGMLQTLMDHIAALRRGETPPDFTPVPAQFAAEYAPLAAARAVAG